MPLRFRSRKTRPATRYPAAGVIHRGPPLHVFLRPAAKMVVRVRSRWRGSNIRLFDRLEVTSNVGVMCQMKPYPSAPVLVRNADDGAVCWYDIVGLTARREPRWNCPVTTTCVSS